MSLAESWSALLASPAEIGFVILRTLVVYAFIFAGFRLTGKREVGQLTPFDFALILLIANAVQNAMVGPSTSLVGGLVAAGVLFLVSSGIGYLALRDRRTERLLLGRARMLVYRGRIDRPNLRAEGLSQDQLFQALRAHGCPTLEQCRLAVLETDGSISVIPYDAEHTAHRSSAPETPPGGAGSAPAG